MILFTLQFRDARQSDGRCGSHCERGDGDKIIEKRDDDGQIIVVGCREAKDADLSGRAEPHDQREDTLRFYVRLAQKYGGLEALWENEVESNEEVTAGSDGTRS